MFDALKNPEIKKVALSNAHFDAPAAVAEEQHAEIVSPTTSLNIGGADVSTSDKKFKAG